MSGFARYPGAEEILHLHRQLSGRFGGSDCVTDRGALDGALARMRSASYRTLSEQGAALLQSLARQPAFESNNNRTAFAACATFMRLNGHRLQVPPDTAAHFMRERVLARNATVQRIATQIERALTPL